MKRALWVAVVSLVLILGLAVYSDGARKNAGNDLMQAAGAVKEMHENGDDERALEEILLIRDRWQGRAERLSMFTDHGLIHAVEDALREMMLALEEGMEYEFRAGLLALEDAAGMLHEQDAFLLKNIL